MIYVVERASLYSVVYLAGAVLVAAVQLTGLIVASTRWHVGIAARFGAIGFGLLLLNSVGQQVFSLITTFIQAVTTPRSADSLLFRHMVAGSVGALISAAGYVFLVLALRAALIEFGRHDGMMTGGRRD